MTIKNFPKSQTPIRKSVELLPKLFQTETNSKFMSGVVDSFVQPGSLDKTVGYIGKRYGKTFNSTDIYLDTDATLRSVYQLDPGVVIKDNDNNNVDGFYDYIDFKNQLRFFENKIDRDDLITSSTHYTWNPPLEWDKLINYREYFWIPQGPPAVNVSGTIGTNVNAIEIVTGSRYVINSLGNTNFIELGAESNQSGVEFVAIRSGTGTGTAKLVEVSTFKVNNGIVSAWVFSPDGLTSNPTITLYRGKTYKFKVNAPDDNFFIRRQIDTGSMIYNPILPYQKNQVVAYNGKLYKAEVDIAAQLNPVSVDEDVRWTYLKDITEDNYLDYNNGVTNNGTSNGVLTFSIPFNAPDLLFYQSSIDPNKFGKFLIASIEENTNINVEKEILGKLSYQSSNGVNFSNGLVVKFIGNIFPVIYEKDSWLVEGVGTGITLTKFQNLIVSPAIVKNSPDVVFDGQGFDSLPFDDASAYPSDKDYITISKSSLDGNAWSRYNRWFHRSVLEQAHTLNNSTFFATENSRAKRPIIEFKPNLQLFQHGSRVKNPVDFIDTFTLDAFSDIEGSQGYIVDGESLFDKARLLITADTDFFVNNQVYVVNFIVHNGIRQISLIKDVDGEPTVNDGILIRRGAVNRGMMFYFDGTTWAKSQQPSAVNQSPLFDMFDSDGYSFSDNTVYPSSSFAGTPIISYKLGNGKIDKELGFKISYLNINNVGDIQFQFNLDSDDFLYQQEQQVVYKKLSSGFYKFNNTDILENGWINLDPKYLQPIIESVTVTEPTNRIVSNAIKWNSITDTDIDKIIFFVNGTKINDKFTRINDTFNFERTFDINDVIVLKLFSSAEPEDGYYEIPLGLEKNPLNQKIASFTLGQASDHIISGLELFDSFSGIYQGENNLRDISGYENLSRRFLKHTGITPVAMVALCDKEINIIKSLQYAKDAYSEFKNTFLSVAESIIYDDNIPNFVDAILKEIGKSKNNSSPFFRSDMIGSGAFTSLLYTVEDEGIKSFVLSDKFDLDNNSNRAVYIYINQQQLIAGKDYEFNSNFGFVTLSIELAEGDVIEIREYVSTSNNFIPSTPTKLGLYKKYTPAMILDDTFVEPREMIQGHDGSLIFAYGDYRDDILLELENRIYNNIKQQYNPLIFDNDKVLGGFYNSEIYNKNQLDTLINADFLRWLSAVNINFTENSYFDSEDSFTYTYSAMTDPLGQQSLPGYWRGVYRWIYDTDRPHRCPWEMLGFSQQPLWWEEEYGPFPYTSNNLILWDHLQEGRITQGERAGIHDRYKRPLLLEHLPVDEYGNLLSPLESSFARNFVLINNKGNFKFGDVSPAEHAWRTSSEYPFSIISALCLLRPFDYISTNFNKSLTTLNISGQTINVNSETFITIDDLILNDTDVNAPVTGLFLYIVDYLKSKAKDKSIIENKIKNIDVLLSNRISGFVDQAQQKYLLDSKSPNSSSSSIFIPNENYNIIFDVSCPISSISYSGLLIEKVNKGWKISGYDSLDPYFEYFKAVASQTDALISVGGISEPFVEWVADKFYSNGILIRYNNKFYRSLQSHTSEDNFNVALWKQLPKVPIVNGIEVFKRRFFDTLSVRKVMYGQVFENIQELADFIQGYEQYQLSLGIAFNGYSSETQTAFDWTTSLKEFMFWTKHNWAEGSLISLSPLAQKIEIDVTVGAAENILDSFYNYQILKSDGAALPLNFINVSRDFQKVTISTTNTNEGIYFLKIYFVLKEHIVLFDDRTVFNDVIYDKPSGYRQDRIKVRGFRTTDWNGDYTSPGFVFDNVNIGQWQPFVDYKLGDIVSYKSFSWTSSKTHLGSETFENSNWTKLDLIPEKGLVANFDYRINQFEDYFEVEADGIGSSQRELARHAIGYQKRDYLQNLAEDDVTQFRLYQGFIREKGTANSVVKIFDKLSKTSNSVILNEEWAFNVGQLGGVDQTTEYEIKLNKINFKMSPQPILITNLSDRYVNNQYIKSTINDFTLRPIPFTTSISPTSVYTGDTRNAGYVKLDHVDFVKASRNNILEIDSTSVKDNSYIWLTFNQNSWTVFRYNINPLIKITNIEITDITVILTTDIPHGLFIGDVFSINNFINLNGFYRAFNTTTNTIRFVTATTIPTPVLEDNPNYSLGILTEARLDNISTLDFSSAPEGFRYWIDSDESEKWKVIEKNSQLNQDEFVVLAQEEPTVDIDLIDNVKLYDPVNQIKLADVDFVNYYKLKILNFAEQSLSFKTIYDPAIYSIGTEDETVDEDQAWFEKNVGKLWWDLNSCKFFLAEQGSVAYRSGNWNNLVEGASVDIYEWVETPLLPEEWSILADTAEGLNLGISGQPKFNDSSVLSVKMVINPVTGENTNKLYYYWVKDSTIIPANIIRKSSASEVRRLIENPAASGFPFISFIENNKFLSYNLENYFKSDSALLNIQYKKKYTNLNPVNNEYQLLTEGVADSVPAPSLEAKWIDSLIGEDRAGNRVPDSTLSDKQKYGIKFRPRQTMFADRGEALKVVFGNVNSVLMQQPFVDLINFDKLNQTDNPPSAVLNEYDTVLDTFSDISQYGLVRAKESVVEIVLINGKIENINITNPGFGYAVSPPITITGDGKNGSATAEIDSQGRISKITVTNKGSGYSVANATIRTFSILVINDSTYDNKWSIYSWDQQRNVFFRSKSQAFDVKQYWITVDWWDTTYSSESSIVKEINSIDQLELINLEVDELIRIKEFANGGWAVVKKTKYGAGDLLNNFTLVGRKNGTIQILESAFNLTQNSTGFNGTGSYDSTLYDLQNSKELRIILDAVKHDIFINDLRVEWNKLFFASVRYAFSEQLYINWAFKTSFLNAIHTVTELSQKLNYRSDNLDSYREYLEEVKPFRTTIREYTSRYTKLENTPSAMTDFDLPPAYSAQAGKVVPINSNFNKFEEYPWKWWADNNGFEITDIEILNAGSDYTSPPSVLIQGNGYYAQARAFISNGRISKIQILNPGTQYTTTPIIELVGGNGSSTNTAKAVAILGNSKIRVFNTSLKFDRICKNGIYENFMHIQEETSSGSESIFNLTYPPSYDSSKLQIFINNKLLLKNNYTVKIYKENIFSSTLSGKVIFNVPPETGAAIKIIYDKNNSILDSVNRINKYYSPATGMIGNDITQLMTGIDFGGVKIQGNSFDVTGGWDAMPWFTDNWDSAKSSGDFYYAFSFGTDEDSTQIYKTGKLFKYDNIFYKALKTTANGEGLAVYPQISEGWQEFWERFEVELPFVPLVGQEISVYLRLAGENTSTRIDDLNYGSAEQTNTNAVMLTIIGDGIFNTVDLNEIVTIEQGDTIIFRTMDSDGAITINDINLLDSNIDGGSIDEIIGGAFITANGKKAEDIVIDGDSFITPDQVPAPEENVPGQVLDSVSIKVFTELTGNAAPLQSSVFVGNGVTSSYNIGLTVFESDSVIVYLDKIKQDYNIDFEIDWTKNTIKFLSTPLSGQSVEIISIGTGGTSLLDYQEFKADGDTSLFLTKADFNKTSEVLVSLDGEQVDIGFRNSSEFLDIDNKTIIQFGLRPSRNQVIKIVSIGNNNSQAGNSLVRVNTQQIISDGRTKTFELDNFVNLNSASLQSSVLVNLNNKQLNSIDTIYVEYNGTNNQVDLNPNNQYLSGTILPSDIVVFINDRRALFVTDYIINSIQDSLTINASKLKKGDIIRINVGIVSDYSISGTQLILSDDVELTESDIIEVTWFSNYLAMNIISDQYMGGLLRYPLSKSVLSSDYVWVYKNGIKLSTSIDFTVDLSAKFVYLVNSTVSSDSIKIVEFANSINQNPSAYEIFKDMLNTVQYTRYAVNSSIVLVNQLNYYDQSFEVSDASTLTIPITNRNIPGVVVINNERIEYLRKEGNILSQLRRGVHGTGISPIHSPGSIVVNIGYTETIPYSEKEEIFIAENRTADNVLLIGPLDFIPTKSTNRNEWFKGIQEHAIPEEFGPCDQIEVFVEGRRLRKDPITVYSEILGPAEVSNGIEIPAEFSVDGITPYIRLTTSVNKTSEIKIVRRQGKIWYDTGIDAASSGQSMLNNTNNIIKFISKKGSELPE
jgi:hypothetical protein